MVGVKCHPDRTEGPSGHLFIDLFYFPLRSEVSTPGCLFPSSAQPQGTVQMKFMVSNGGLLLGL